MGRLSVVLALLCASSACASAPPPAPRGVVRIVAIGDSITRGGAGRNGVSGHENSVEGGWVTRLATALEARRPGRYELFNEGIDGDVARGVAARLDEDVIAYRPEVVILAIGTNDVYGEGVRGRLFSPRAALTPEAYGEVVDAILARLEAKLPAACVVLVGMATPLVTYWERSRWGFMIALPEQAELQRRFAAYNHTLAALAEARQLAWVDVAASWPEEEARAWALSADGIHPDDAGYALLAELVERAVTGTPCVAGGM